MPDMCQEKKVLNVEIADITKWIIKTDCNHIKSMLLLKKKNYQINKDV